MVVLSWGISEACQCALEPTAVEALALADAGFVGTVVDQRTILHIDGPYTGPGIEYDVIVQRAWKGVGERQLSLQRLSRCAPSFGVGTTSLIYASRVNGSLIIPNCLPTKRLDEAAAALLQLGAPMVTFPGPAEPVATALPVSRWVRAHVVAGIAVYAFTYVNRDWASSTSEMILVPVIAALFMLAAGVSFVRRRRRVGAGRLAAAVLTLAASVFWTGHVFLRSDWSAPFLRW